MFIDNGQEIVKILQHKCYGRYKIDFASLRPRYGNNPIEILKKITR